MKIGIITCWNSQDNYGQQLQCYALQTLLKSWGHEAILIRYAPVIQNSFFQKLKLYLRKPDKLLKLLPIDTEEKRQEKMEQKLKKKNSSLNIIRGFEQFREVHIKMTENIYTSYKQLYENPPQADVYITGSDQVWHSSCKINASRGWYLQFGKQETIRLSYAASIGRNLYDSELPLFRDFLKKFDAISVREESARQLCVKQGFDAQLCVDPTMLLPVETYHNIATSLPFKSEEYAFLYILNVKRPEDFYWPEIRKSLQQKKLQTKIVVGSGYYQARELIEDEDSILATIPEWLGLIMHARCVFTTSFHGTIFSILMHRPFLAIGLQGRYIHSNTRIEHLLYMLGISERIMKSDQDVWEQMEAPINWEDVDIRLAQACAKSTNFLKTALNQNKLNKND